MPFRQGLILVVVAACQAKSAEPGRAGSGSAVAPPPALSLSACAVADPRPAKMRSGSPSAVDHGIPGPGGGTGEGGRLAIGRPRMAVKSVEVTGALDKVIARRYVRRQQQPLEACYAAALAKAPALAGTLAVTFDVDKTGAPANARATGIPGSLPGCVAKVIAQTRFPVAAGATRVAFSFAFSTESPAPPPPPTAWTPYAIARGPAPADPSSVEAMQAAIRGQLVELDACFAGANGSVRAMIQVTADGHVQRARVGGLGTLAPEVCLARALQKLAIVSPSAPVELACDLVRGGPQPWRVTNESYRVFDVTAPAATGYFTPGETATAYDAHDGASLVLVTPDAPGATIERVVTEASSSQVTLVAVTATGGPPVFAGIGPDTGTTIDGTANLGLAVTRGIARVCTDGAAVTRTAPVIDPKALDALIAAGVAACKTPCTAASVSVVGDFIGKDLVALTAATRRAKLATIVAGQACPP